MAWESTDLHNTTGNQLGSLLGITHEFRFARGQSRLVAAVADIKKTKQKTLATGD